MRRGNAGDPCKRRFRVMKDGWRSPHGCRWRVFELVQPGQTISLYGDHYYSAWEDAMRYADTCVRSGIRACQGHTTEEATL